MIFVPYNYLFDRDARKSTFGEHVNFDNAVLIFDEAHNLEEFASESSSFDITSANVAACVAEVQRALQYMDMLNMDGGGGDISGGGLKRHNVLSLKSLYRVHVTKMIGGTNAAGGGGFAGGRTISFWCFTPALAMRELSFLNVRSIIITSGTLSPLPSCAMELGLKFPVQLENDHVIGGMLVFFPSYVAMEAAI